MCDARVVRHDICDTGVDVQPAHDLAGSALEHLDDRTLRPAAITRTLDAHGHAVAMHDLAHLLGGEKHRRRAVVRQQQAVAVTIRADRADGEPGQLFAQFLVGSVLAGIGMLLLFAGVEMGILPMGRFIGAEMPRKRSLKLIMAVGFTMGLATTLAEPDVLVLANQVEEASRGALQAHPLALVIAAFAAVPMLQGCDRRTPDPQTTTTPGGGTTTPSETVPGTTPGVTPPASAASQ